MIIRILKSVFLLICIIGLLLLPASEILTYNQPMGQSLKDFQRVLSERVEHTDYHSSDISTFVNDYFIFYVPPATNQILDTYRINSYGGYSYKNGNYIIANLSSIQIFSYENGAEVEIEWLNCSMINGTRFNPNDERWEISQYATVKWLENLPSGVKKTKRTIELDEYTTEEIQLTAWVVYGDFRVLSGVVKITSDFPISVMHHRLYPLYTEDDNGYELINSNWDGVFSAYCKKLFTRITGDCWISALEANTEVHVWDYSDKNDDITLTLDRFEGWDYSRNAVFEQYGFDDDLVLISADKPVSIVAGLQADQCFVQVFGKGGKDFLFPCFGNILIHAPNGASIDLDDKNGNQGSYKGTLEKDEMRVFDFKVAYKQRYYSSFEWAHLRASEPVLVYTFVNNSWYLDESVYGMISGEEYITTYKKTTQFYSHGVVPYPADTEFTVPLRSRAYVTIVNLDNSGNDVEVDHSRLSMPYNIKLDKYQPVTLDFSEDSYYPMDLVNPQTGNPEKSSWLYSDPRDRHFLDRIPRIAVQEDDPETAKLLQKVSFENITQGSVMKIKSEHPVLVFIDYNKDQAYYPQGADLIPGLTPPTKRSLPEFPAMVVIIAGMIIAIDMIIVATGKKSLVESFLR